MLDLSQFEVITFDCYGTLIDWETGIVRFFQEILQCHGIKVNDSELLEAYAFAETKAESGKFISYRAVLEQVVRDIGSKFAFVATPEEQQSLPESVKAWQPFPDTVEALKRLHRRYRLAIISNVDDDLFAHTAKLLEVPFEFVTTALEVRSYKPSLNNFRRAAEKMKIAQERVLHVAQSLYHDIEPARELGLRSVWVNRRRGKQGGGATVSSSAKPDLEVPDLKTLADLAQR